MPDTLIYWTHFVAVALFALGLVGLLVRKHVFSVIFSTVLMLNAPLLLFAEGAMRRNVAATESILFLLLIIFFQTVISLLMAAKLQQIRNASYRKEIEYPHGQ